jgi:tRNA/tmRNA/rRNA uracil-C5-methylase (TrmA/RlmC/RlmD family)
MSRPAEPRLRPGAVLELSVGQPVHGGWCLARPDGSGGSGHRPGLVILVRHALPGERVRVIITQVASRFARADAVQVLAASPGRVTPPCPHAGPGRCGGCDWQHASLPAQRALKGQVITELLRRIAGLDLAVEVEPVPGDEDGLGWRSRVRFSVTPDGRAGLLAHRSHRVTEITDCLIAHPLIRQLEITRRSWPGARSVEAAAAPATGGQAVTVHPRRRAAPDGPARRYLIQAAAGQQWRVAAGGFWQVHTGAADVLAAAVLASLAPREGEHAVDIFCGSGLFAGVLARAVGPAGAVLAIERDPAAAADARHNLRGIPWARVRCGDAAQVLDGEDLSGAAIAVADPPRGGLAPELAARLAGSPLRRIAYVSCEPATLARDIAVLGRGGWQLAGLRAFDAFPMTHHAECVATLAPAGESSPG